jgi:DNA polymerase I-like protein with 3'-5' exonuclease and polymerase domains
VLDKWYDGEHVTTPFHRKIKVDRRRAFNYIIQSTTSDIVIDRAIEIEKYLLDKKSFISHIVHDEIVIDLDSSEREMVPEIKDMFENTKLGNFMCNLNAGKDYFDLQGLKL